MSAEIQTSLFILTAEIAAVTSVAALVAAGLAWARGRARLKAAAALRDAAARLPGEGEVVQKERELLGEFARAYLTRDAERLAGLPARLLSVRQAIEAAVEPPAPEIDPAEIQAQAMQALEAERAEWQARLEGLEQQRMQTQQQLDTALATINTLVQEYGRGRGQEITPTAEALLQALLQVGGVGTVAAAADRIEPTHATGAVPLPHSTPPAAEPSEDEALMDLAIEDEVVLGTGLEPSATAGPEAQSAADEPVATAEIDALLEDVLGPSANASANAAPEPSPPAEEVVVEPQVAAPEAAVVAGDQGLDLSVPVEPVVEAATKAAPPGDELDELDIDALLDAELGRQAQLLTPVEAPGEEQHDLARVDEPGTKK